MTACPSQSSLRYVLSATLLVALLLHPGARAHRDHGVWTEVLWAETHFEITHRIHISDALILLAALEAGASIDTPRGNALLALHVEKNFSISARKESFPMNIIGSEIRGDFLLVYQESYVNKPSVIPSFSNTSLHLIYSDYYFSVLFELDNVATLLSPTEGSYVTIETQLPESQ